MAVDPNNPAPQPVQIPAANPVPYHMEQHLTLEQRAKIDYEHRKKLHEIVIDKLFLGGVLGLFASIGGCVVSISVESFKTNQAKILADNQTKQATILADYQTALSQTLENHRMALQSQQFLVQKRYEALDQIVQSYNKLFETFTKAVRIERRDKLEKLPDEERKQYRALMDKIVTEVNRRDLILPTSFSREVEKHIHLHRGLLYKNLSTYQPFIRFLADQLTEQARAQIEHLPARKTEFELEPLPEIRTDESAAKYLDLHNEKWRSSRKNDSR